MNELRNTGQNKGLRETPTSRPATEKYRDGWDLVFKQKEELKEQKEIFEKLRESL